MMLKRRRQWNQESDSSVDGRRGSDKRISYPRSDPCLFLSFPLFCPNDGWRCNDDLELHKGGGMEKSGLVGFRVNPLPEVGRVADEYVPLRVRMWVISPTLGGLKGEVRMLGTRLRPTLLPTL
ncbi:unnamed protein product [Linum trigynum]|uniref:Uncharacterized protein n=1 Tax=Linum trigynum TaxID=586398 RepID=A0AAV2GNK9_9ROSI